MTLLDLVVAFQFVSGIVMLVALVLTKDDFEAAVHYKEMRRLHDEHKDDS